MRRMAIAVLLGLLISNATEAGWFKADVKPADLRCEYLKDPLGIDEAKPRLSWITDNRQQTTDGRQQGS
jgi:hypothetical protein